jgi:hypothetical protein
MTQQKLLESKRQEILEALHQGTVNLQFKKVNGDLRNMVATLKSDLIPEKDIPEEGKERKSNENIVVLYDLQVEGWRSFRIENLVEYRCDAWL